MSVISQASGEQLVIQLGNGATPEVFAASYTINTTRTLDLTATASSTELADPITPSNPAQVWRQIKSIDLKFSGSGIADAPSIAALVNWWQGGQPKNVKIIQNRTGAAGGFTFSLAMVVTSLQLAGVRGDLQTFTGTFEASGTIAFAPNP